MYKISTFAIFELEIEKYAYQVNYIILLFTYLFKLTNLFDIIHETGV